MKRRNAIGAVAGGLAGSACRPKRRARLNVWNWSGYVGPDTIANFEQEFGVDVRYAVYESNEEMLSRVMSGNSGWDVVFPTSYLLAPMREMGLVKRLDRRALRNLDQLAPAFRAPRWDPQLEWSVPYMWNATGICCSTRVIGPGGGSWDLLWGRQVFGRATMLDDPVDVFAACLTTLGYSVNTSDGKQIREARDLAIERKRALRAFLNAEVRDQLVSGDVLAAQLWSTTAQQAMDASASLEFVYPAEGFPLYPDLCVVLQESERGELAHKFIDYLLRPEVAAGVVAAARTACANGGARRLLSPEILRLPTLFPSDDTLARGEWVLPSPPAVQRLRDRYWTEIKTA